MISSVYEDIIRLAYSKPEILPFHPVGASCVFWIIWYNKSSAEMTASRQKHQSRVRIKCRSHVDWHYDLQLCIILGLITVPVGLEEIVLKQMLANRRGFARVREDFTPKSLSLSSLWMDSVQSALAGMGGNKIRAFQILATLVELIQSQVSARQKVHALTEMRSQNGWRWC